MFHPNKKKCGVTSSYQKIYIYGLFYCVVFFWVLCIYLESGMFVKILIKKISLILVYGFAPAKLENGERVPTRTLVAEATA